jgi:hypothetical protein
MPNIEQSALVLALSSALRERGSWAGETHIQKAGYLLQHLLNVPLAANFILYKHGPFSFDLRGLLAEMESQQFVAWEPRPYPYGPTLVPGSCGQLLQDFAKSPKTFQPQIEFVAEKLASKRVADVERLATALYVTLDNGVPKNERSPRIHALKPHVTIREAEAAVAEIDSLRSEAEQKGLVSGRTSATTG